MDPKRYDLMKTLYLAAEEDCANARKELAAIADKVEWQPIEKLPARMKNTKEMFVVKAIDANITIGDLERTYTSDPWCVWTEQGKFIRWPHTFAPTHWKRL